MAVKFIHTADWQLGKAFARFGEEAAVPLREQRVQSIKKIAALAEQHKVDAVLVAGDVFEFETIAEKTLHQTLHAMSTFKGFWLMLPGNHDPATPESVWSQLRHIDAPENVIIFDKPTAFEIPGKNAVVMAAPLQRKHDSNDITEWFDTHATESDTIRIGLAHGSVDNRLPDRGEAPNTISDLRAEKAKLDYLALGDWHGTLNVANNTWYSGTHETDRFRSNDSGNVLLVEIDSPGATPKVEKIATGHYRWRQIAPAVEGTLGADQIAKALEQLGEPPENLVVQVIPKGVASLETRALIDKVITRWSGLVRYLEYKEDNLVSEASADDLDELGRTGFVGEAVEKLRQLSADMSNPEHEIAALALQIMYAEHKQLVNKR